MTEPLKIAFVVAIGPTLMGLASLWASIKNRSKLEALHGELNSRLTLLLNLAKAEARAAGIAEGRELGIAERERTEDRIIEINDKAAQKEQK